LKEVPVPKTKRYSPWYEEDKQKERKERRKQKARRKLCTRRVASTQSRKGEGKGKRTRRKFAQEGQKKKAKQGTELGKGGKWESIETFPG